jgi:tetratricopeptide (TPR) repeat protein
VKLPHGVRESIRRRCAKLSARANYLIRIAAVIGNEFDYEIVNANFELPMGQLLDLVDECCAAGLLTAIGDRRCRFSHALIRSSIYEELPNGERLKLHLQIGDALEQISAANPGSHLAALAHHFRQAADNPNIAERAILYSVRAGEAGAAVFAYEETRSHWEGALKLMERFGASLEKRAELLERFGSDQVVSSSSDMVRFLEEALALYRQCGRRDRAASIQGWLGYSLAVLPGPQMDVRRGLALLRRAEDEARPGPDSYDKAIIYISLAGAAHQAIESHEGLAAAERAAQIAGTINNPTLWAAAVAAVGIHSLRLGQVADAYALLGQARMNVEPSIRAATSAIAAWGGLFCITLWDPAEAESWYAAELTRPRTMQMANWRSLLLHQRIEAEIIRGELTEARRTLDELGHGGRLSALIALYDGDWDRALTVAVKQLQDSRRIGSRFIELSCHFALGRIHAARGEEREAEASLRHALTIARAGPHRPAEVEARAGLALVYAHTEKPGDAAEQLSRCSELIGTAQEWRGLAGTVARAQAAVAAAAGKFDTAFLEFDRAASIFERYSLAWEEAETFQQWGLALMANGDHRLASEKFLAAANLYKRCGAGGVWIDRAQSTTGSFGPPESDRSGSHKDQAAADNERSHDLQGVFRRDGEYWTVGFSDHTLRLKDSKGLGYLANLLARPGTEISARDLAASGGTATKKIQYETRIWDGAAELAVGLGDAGAMLDRRAVAQYKRRLAELDEQIAEAERNHDTGRYDTVQRERECLVHELSAALGLGGKERRVASHSERARWLVTKGIKGAIRKIAQANSDLGHHLRLSVRTGSLCVYLPAQPVSWQF